MTEAASPFTVTLAQLNPIVGDVAGNAAKARAARKQASAEGLTSLSIPNCSLPAIRRKTWC